ncbi:hypothetical protein [Spirosoma utsteinense]|uniref:Uncharacterized protein n=1 Tax=Spirosoma utsteinense TaxID=2585773 RepID=A0ABR6WC03_9BACT|nr:hypothetical protein [Spirosoma utsteinense]MBC3787577.1 hypothetical protein [Spirosoma utsteinense]MBC3794107.1 hypothetical protein [Spirosoma utsteinense]
MVFSSGSGQTYCQATSSGQFVETLWRLSGLSATTSIPHFMIQLADHIQTRESGKELIVRTDTTDHFVDDLIQCGLVKIVP